MNYFQSIKKIYELVQRELLFALCVGMERRNTNQRQLKNINTEFVAFIYVKTMNVHSNKRKKQREKKRIEFSFN